jgi:hypothetical protein
MAWEEGVKGGVHVREGGVEGGMDVWRHGKRCGRRYGGGKEVWKEVWRCGGVEGGVVVGKRC